MFIGLPESLWIRSSPFLANRGVPSRGVEAPLKKNNGRETRASVPSVFSASLQWLCPSTIKEEEVI